VGLATDDYTDKAVGYHIPTQKWCQFEMNLSWIFTAVPPGLSLDDDEFDGLDTAEYSLDDRLWDDFKLALAGFDDQFRLVFFTGENAEATLRTPVVQFARNAPSFVTGHRPHIEGITTPYYGCVGTKYAVNSAREWTTEVANNDIGEIEGYAEGLSHQFELRIPEGTVWNSVSGTDVMRAAGGTFA
jgi:hypothetical protein